MHITTTKENLIPSLTLVSGAADTRGTIPMLSTVLLKAVDGGKLSTICSDSGTLARSLAPCEVKASGEIAVDVKRLTDLIRAVPDKSNIEMSIEEGKEILLVKSGRSRFRLPTRSAADYPRMAASKDKRVSVTIDGKRLAEMIEQVSASIATADIRTYLNGVQISLEEGGLWLASTDGFRLTVAFEPVPSMNGVEPMGVILPRKTALLARRLLALGGQVKLTLSERDVQFSFDSGEVLLGLGIDGKFPAWRKAIPEATDKVVADVAKLRESLAMISATLPHDNKNQSLNRKIDLGVEKNLLTIQHGDSGRCEIEAEAGGSPFDLSFNIDFLLDAVAATGSGEKVRIEYASATKMAAIAIRPNGSAYPLAVVMPMRG